MSLFVTLSLLIGAHVGICSIILLIEQAYDKRVEKRKNTDRRFRWLWDSGLKESACIIYPITWRDLG